MKQNWFAGDMNAATDRSDRRDRAVPAAARETQRSGPLPRWSAERPPRRSEDHETGWGHAQPHRSRSHRADPPLTQRQIPTGSRSCWQIKGQSPSNQIYENFSKEFLGNNSSWNGSSLFFHLTKPCDISENNFFISFKFPRSLEQFQVNQIKSEWIKFNNENSTIQKYNYNKKSESLTIKLLQISCWISWRILMFPKFSNWIGSTDLWIFLEMISQASEIDSTTSGLADCYLSDSRSPRFSSHFISTI